MDPTRFPIRFSGAGWVVRIGGVSRRGSYAELSPDALTVHMSWSFRTIIPRSAIGAAGRAPDGGITLGVHGWRGRWLVNGSRTGLVRVTLTEPVRAWVLGVPIRLRELTVSLEDPAAFLAALGDR